MASGLTDYADGKIARKFHMESRLGQFLDPIADKLLVAAVLFAFLLGAVVRGAPRSDPGRTQGTDTRLSG